MDRIELRITMAQADMITAALGVAGDHADAPFIKRDIQALRDWVAWRRAKRWGSERVEHAAHSHTAARAAAANRRAVTKMGRSA